MVVVLQGETYDKRQEEKSLACLAKPCSSQPHQKRNIFQRISNMVLQSAPKWHFTDV
jgi:hypothetical protein